MVSYTTTQQATVNWFCIVYNNVMTYQNLCRTFLTPVEGGIEALIAGVNDDLLRRLLSRYNGRPEVYLWDLGEERASKLNIGDGLIIRLDAGADRGAHYCYVEGKLIDLEGEIGDLVGWHRFHGGPWSTPMLVTAPCDASNRPPNYLEDKIEIMTWHGHRAKFYRLPHGERIVHERSAKPPE
jgi:hypothetical protein